jgi:hypothetical protein
MGAEEIEAIETSYGTVEAVKLEHKNWTDDRNSLTLRVDRKTEEPHAKAGLVTVYWATASETHQRASPCGVPHGGIKAQRRPKGPSCVFHAAGDRETKLWRPTGEGCDGRRSSIRYSTRLCQHRLAHFPSGGDAAKPSNKNRARRFGLLSRTRASQSIFLRRSTTTRTLR